MSELKTHVSKAYWYNENNSDFFEEACVCFGPCQSTSRSHLKDRCKLNQCEANRYKQVAWFDQLFRGAIHLPDTDRPSRPLSILIAGAPGSGKTTLCSEICYNLALQENGRHNSLYASTESESHNIISNFESFGYDHASDIFEVLDEKKTPLKKSGKVLVYGKERFDEVRDKEAAIRKFQSYFTLGMEMLNPALPSEMWNLIWGETEIRPLLSQHKGSLKWPHVMVFDSLNVMPVENAGKYINKIIKNADGIKALFLIMDVSPTHAEYKIWEHFCDIVVKLDYANVSGYYTRTIEVVKARYQSHIWGKHPFKIYRPYHQAQNRDIQQEREVRRRSHPYRKQGGIFIYPSIHFFLSEYKHMEPPPRHAMQETLPRLLNEMLKKPGAENGGYPDGRCTAFVGERGGHKSHLAYLHLLHRINLGESGLVISLRDDENMTRNTMNGIYCDFRNREYGEKKNRSDLSAGEIYAVEEMEEKGKLEILYFHPGYITPEEFFHRVFIAVQKLKRKCKRMTVLFNSLDQLSARFPLCAEKDMFIPGLINFLTAEQISSIFVAVPEEEGQPTEQYGLLPMADLILSFKRKKVNRHAYEKAVLKVCRERFQNKALKYENTLSELLNMKDKYIDEVVLEVVRFSGGQRAGACGVLELIDKNNKKLKDYYDRPGLHFTELPDVDWEYDPFEKYIAIERDTVFKDLKAKTEAKINPAGTKSLQKNN